VNVGLSDAAEFRPALAPALGPCAALLPETLRRWAGGASVAQALDALLPGLSLAPSLAAGPLCFVPQAALPDGEPYEVFIHRSAAVPTRDNLHDLFNGLVWCSEPVLKRRLNELQARAINRDGVQPRRGPLRDALTLMDENGALLDAPAPLWAALRARDWQALFVSGRALWAQARLKVVGHALLAQLHEAPRKPLTAHVLMTQAGGSALDQAIAMPAEAWAAKPFLPLPVLGVPGWWPANTAPGFYDDVAVFRPRRPAPAS
jgi:hypothetical protein